MKRLICTILILCLIPVCIYAEKTDDELKEEFHIIVEELMSRGIWLSDTISNGL